MNLHTFIKKSKDYISCFVKYGAAVIVAPFAKNKEKYKDLWLIAERGIDARIMRIICSSTLPQIIPKSILLTQ